jgi:hypothetical protein
MLPDSMQGADLIMISSLLGKSSWKCYVARLNARGGPECGVDALMLKESTIFAQYIGNMIVDRNKCREHASEQKNMNLQRLNFGMNLQTYKSYSWLWILLRHWRGRIRSAS